MPRQRAITDPGSASPKWEEILRGPERFRTQRDRLVLADRGDLPVLRLLSQTYDRPNVIALEIELGGLHLRDVRKLDRHLEHRLMAARRAAVKHEAPDAAIPFAVAAVIG